MFLFHVIAIEVPWDKTVEIAVEKLCITEWVYYMKPPERPNR